MHYRKAGYTEPRGMRTSRRAIGKPLPRSRVRSFEENRGRVVGYNLGSEAAMGSKSKPYKGSSRRVRERSLLGNLKAEEAQAVLHRLLKAHPDLSGEAERIARSLLHEREFSSIADEVEENIRALGYDELEGRAGRHEWGYVEPDQAALDVLEGTIEPFRSDIKRHLDLGLEAEALEICKGVVLGLYRLREGRCGELLKLAPEFPVEAAAYAVEIWFAGGDDPTSRSRGQRAKRVSSLPKFLEIAPDWGPSITRLLSKKN